MKKVEIICVTGEMGDLHENVVGSAEYDSLSGLWDLSTDAGYRVVAVMVDGGELVSVYADHTAAKA